MNNIDWINAPDGATHAHKDSKSFYRLRDNSVDIYMKGEWRSSVMSRADLKDDDRFHLLPSTGITEKWQTPHIDPDDGVNHPKHYQIADGLEAIDVIRQVLTYEQYKGYLIGNMLKYRLRAGNKGDANQDIAKADWYKQELNK